MMSETIQAFPYDQTSTQPEERLSREERAKRDAEEAEQIVASHYNNDQFTFPTTKLTVGIRRLPEASYQRFFFDTKPFDPPVAPYKTMKNRRGKDILAPDYDNENYLKSVDVYNTHTSLVRQHQMGEMMKYIVDKGVILDLSDDDWEDLYDEHTVGDEEISRRELKYRHLVENGKTNGESKALLIAICGFDPLGRNVDDEDDNE